MKSIEKKDDYLFYENIQDMVEFLKHAPRIGNDDTEYATDREDDDGFYGNMSYQEALEKLEFGDKETAENIENIENQTMMTQKIMQTYKNDVYGFMPNVPNAIMGLPQSMINIRHHRIKGNNKIIDLVLNADVSAAVSGEKYQKVTKTFLNIVDSLEKQGYRLNIYYAITTIFSNSDCCWLMKLKDSTEPFNKYKCAFPLGTAAMFRRIGFRLIETLPSKKSKREVVNGGYGRPAHDEKMQKLIKNNFQFNNIATKNLVIFDIGDYIGVSADEIINKIKGE